MKSIKKFKPGLSYGFNIGFLISLLLTACAIIGPGPTGGKKDKKPPVVKEESPPNKTVNFSETKIVITFDEFVNLDNVFKEVIVSPTLPKLPEITVNRRVVTINLKNVVLLPNTTYSIQFGNAIKDVNEGNVLRNYRYVFSTGSYLDSLFIKGKVIEALSHKPALGYKMELYKAGNDSGIYKKKPLYYARTDSSGRFNINYLPKGKYQLYALNDKNDNYFIDEGEDIGFPPGVVVLDSSIIMRDSIPAFPYTPTQFIVKKTQLFNHSLQVKFDHLVDSVNVYANGKPFYTNLQKMSQTQDSFTTWMGESFPGMEVKAYYKGFIVDTVVKASEKLKPAKFIYEVSSNGDNGNIYGLPVILKASRPIANINLSKVKLYKDTIPLKDFSYRFLDSTRTIVALIYNYEENKTYKYKFWPGSITSIFNEISKDTLQVSATIPGAANFGYFEMTTITGSGNYIFQLVSDNGSVVFYRNVSRETLVKIPFVNPGKYTARLIKDDNMNGRWDGGDLKTRKEPEAVYYFPKAINIKANWELVGLKFDLTKKDLPAKKP